MHTVYTDEVGCLRLEDHSILGWLLHVDIYKWSKDAFKHTEKVFDDILLDLSDRGVDHLSAVIATKDIKLQKFAEAYGLIKTGKQMILIDKPDKLYELWEVTTGVL